MATCVDENSFDQRARWLIRLRWLAAVAVALATCVCARVLGVPVREVPLYGVALLLFIYNAVALALLNRFTSSGTDGSSRNVKRLISFQISADLIILAVLLHFSGGPENPFVLFFIFHMIIASILLSVRESYLQATLAVLLFGLLLLLEYTRVAPHHCLKGFIVSCRYEDRAYLLGMFVVFALTLYLVVYMASYIAVRLRRAEQAQRQSNLQLREKDRVKDEYVARLTHDVKGHLAAIQACLGVAVTGAVNGQTADFVQRAFRRTKKLAAFVGMLLRLTELRLNGNLAMGPFPIQAVVGEAVSAVRPSAGSKPLHLECDVGDAATVSGNRDSIEEVVTHLLLNAIKYTPAHGTVRVRTVRQGDSVVVEVSDTGIGVPEAEQARVFDEFFRASNARQIEREGTGLGLSLAKHIVELHGGTIGLSSKPGSGTTLCVVLPRSVSRQVHAPVVVGTQSHG